MKTLIKLLMMAVLFSHAYQKTLATEALNDSNFHTAIDLWFSNESEANATYGHIRDWNVSAVTNMSQAFYNREAFNEDISEWDMRSVTNMESMFKYARSFNQPIGNWDVSKVTTMRFTFGYAEAFNQPVGDWNVSSLVDMQGTFLAAKSFNQPIGNWDVSSVTDMVATFERASVFDQPIADWNVSSVTSMSETFSLAKAFNQDLSTWEIRNVQDMRGMFTQTNSLSSTNKGKIHRSFSSNPKWLYQWAEYAGYTPLNNANFSNAIALWFSDKANATSTYGHIVEWDVSAVTDMSNAFLNRSTFNQPIGDWNVSSVTSMTDMFKNTSTVELDLLGNEITSGLSDANKALIEVSFSYNSNWPYDWSNLVGNAPLNDANFLSALGLWFDNEAEAISTYGHISNWNVSAVTDMGYAFSNRFLFNEDISRWDVSNVTNMYKMFDGCDAFNQPIGEWDVSAVRTMAYLFRNAHSFNQPIGNWDVSSVSENRGMRSMFRGAISFNQPIGNWNTAAVPDMGWMFDGATSFNQPIGGWDVSSVTTMSDMFDDASSFNQEIGNWNVSSVTTMKDMFEDALAFNQPIGNWNVASLTNTEDMFKNATSFNQSIGSWNVSAVTSMKDMFLGSSALSNVNKGKIYKKFSSNLNWPYSEWNQYVALAYVVIDESNLQKAIEIWLNNETDAEATYGHISDWNISDVIDSIKVTSKAEGITEGIQAVKSNPSFYNLVTQQAYNDLLYSLDANATPYTPEWFYIPDHGWMWSQKDVYPWFYDSNSSDWLYFQSGHDKPKFYSNKSEEWITLE